MSNHIGKWFWIRSENSIPDETERSYYYPSHGWGVLLCVAENDGLLDLKLQDGFTIHRVKEEDATPRPAPAFRKGDHVRIISKNRVVDVEGAYWHFKDERYFYHLVDENGKMMKKRYLAEELEPAEGKP